MGNPMQNRPLDPIFYSTVGTKMTQNDTKMGQNDTKMSQNDTKISGK